MAAYDAIAAISVCYFNTQYESLLLGMRLYYSPTSTSRKEVIEYGVFEPDSFNLIAVIHSNRAMTLELKQILEINSVPIVEINSNVDISINTLRDDILTIVKGPGIISVASALNTNYH